MVSNSEDEHPSRPTPIRHRVPNTPPITVKQAVQASKQFLPVGRENSKQPMAHAGIQFDEVHSWIPL